MQKDSGEDVLHAAGATPVIAVVEVETFALENESAEAILDGRMVSVLRVSYGMSLIAEGGVGGRVGHTLAVEVVRRAFTGIFVVTAGGRACFKGWM